MNLCFQNKFFFRLHAAEICSFIHEIWSWDIGACGIIVSLSITVPVSPKLLNFWPYVTWNLSWTIFTFKKWYQTPVVWGDLVSGVEEVFFCIQSNLNSSQKSESSHLKKMSLLESFTSDIQIPFSLWMLKFDIWYLLEINS